MKPENIQNYNLKLNLISEFNEGNCLNSLNLIFNGISLKINSNKSLFIDELKAGVPKKWLLVTENPVVKIFIKSPEDFSVPLSQFEDEPSQDCFIDNNSLTEIAVQRDFVSKRIGDDKIHAILNQKWKEDGFYNFLRWLLPHHLIKSNRTFLHSSAVLGRDNKAHVFLGHSGAGKSTITTLSGEREVLADDMNILEVKDRKLFISAGAIGGLEFPNVDFERKYEITSFYWLKQSSINELILLDHKQGMSKIMASMANIFWDDAPEWLKVKTMSMARNCVENCPLYTLSFKKDDTFWSLIDG